MREKLEKVRIKVEKSVEQDKAKQASWPISTLTL